MYFAISFAFTMIMPYPMPVRPLIICLCLVLGIFSCKKDEKAHKFEVANVGVDMRLNDVILTSSGEMLACGGVRDVSGSFFRSEDGGVSWSGQEGMAEQSIYAIEMIDDLRGWAGGGFLNLWKTGDGGQTWSNHWIGLDVPFDENERPAIKKFQFLSDSTFFFVGGDNYTKGVVYSTVDAGDNFEFKFLHNEMLGIHMTDKDHGIICGYGRLLTTNSGMQGWTDQNQTDDFYTGLVSFPDHYIICSLTGSILKSETIFGPWEEVLEGNSWLSWKRSFNDIYKDENCVVAVGNDGYFAVSDDAGLSWNSYELSEPVELFSVFIYDAKAWCASTDGNIISFNIP